MYPEVNELREDVPLKAAEKRNRLCCTCSEDCMGGSKFINISFGTLTVIITIALLVQIYYGDYQVRKNNVAAHVETIVYLLLLVRNKYKSFIRKTLQMI